MSRTVAGLDPGHAVDTKSGNDSLNADAAPVYDGRPPTARTPRDRDLFAPLVLRKPRLSPMFKKPAAPLRSALPALLPRHRGASPAVPRVATVRRWVAELPLASLSTSAGLLHRALREINEAQGLSVRCRLELLETLAPVLDHTLRGLPGADRRTAAATDGVTPLALLREIGRGYALVVDAHRQRGARVGRRQLTQALQRCLRYAGMELLQYYHVARPAPAGYWQALHGLYRCAEEAAVEALEVNDPQLGERVTVADTYKRVLLTAAANPGRLRRQELDELYAALRPWAPLVSLRTLPAPPAAWGAFVQLAGDAPPQPFPPEARLDGRQLRLLDWSAALASLESVEPAPPAWWRRLRAPAAVPADARALLLKLFGVRWQRRFPRRALERPAQLLTGLNAISRLLAGEQGLDLEAEPGSPIAGLTLQEDADAWFLDEDSGWRRLPGTGLVPATARLETALPVGAACLLLDTSAGGYRLLLSPVRTGPARVGELVALRESVDDGAGPWQIGVVRWLQVLPQGTQVGLQLLGVNAVPVSLRPSAGELRPSLGLLLPELKPLRQPPTLLTPMLPYVEGLRARVRGGDGERELVLRSEQEATGAFKAFLFREA